MHGMNEKSTSERLIRYASGSLYVTKALQKVEVMSSTESECMTIFKASKRIVWPLQKLIEPGVKHKGTTIQQYNVLVVKWVEGGPARHLTRWKHVDILFLYVLQIVGERNVV